MIRTMELTDCDRVYKIENECFFEPWSKKNLIKDLKTNKHKRHFVYDIKGEAVGFYIISKILDEVEIYTIAVDKAFRGQDIGTFMLKRLIEDCISLKVSKIWLEVSTKNDKALGLYEKFDFKKIRLRKNYYSKTNEDAYIMLKELV